MARYSRLGASSLLDQRNGTLRRRRPRVALIFTTESVATFAVSVAHFEEVVGVESRRLPDRTL
ncbi:hypothetical protein WOLCODRAFT_29192 [Wolfiporia cocos MD-104 SS10]|uniref:Uncharacterized protein n=1 Tax=Wolfiporia cocos (strain MD-104) TaxID=742152 RepID=A0A2H3JLQ5_WOLCO|nr:hypothetical protein WOLCODRAFT_29192 [Wolfiporia cocos MD-104 SS10]